MTLTPLTKKRKSGQAYARRASTAQQLLELAGLSRDAVLRRLDQRDHRHADFVETECVVYLLREANRQGNRSAWFERLFAHLDRRLDQNLRWAISYGAVNDAESLREDIKQEFYVLLAKGLREEPERLDPFEVFFDKAFAALRTNCLNKAKRPERRETGVVDGKQDDQEDGEREIAEPEPENAMGLNEIELSLFRSQASALIDHLSDKEKRAVKLVLQGHHVEASSPDKPSVAEICGVDVRTINNWLRNARKRFDDLHGETR
jgi:DNA-directed RNA polymerase specialized sigma24 family protein